MVYHYEFENIDSLQEIKKLVPKESWDNLIAELFNLNILNMPDQSEIENYNGDGTDGFGYYVEVATQK